MSFQAKHEEFRVSAETLSTNPFVLGHDQKAQMLRSSGMIAGVDDSFIGSNTSNNYLTAEQKEKRKAQIMQQMATLGIVDQLIADIDIKLEAIAVEINALEERQIKITTEINDLTTRVDEAIEERTVLGDKRTEQKDTLTVANTAEAEAEEANETANAQLQQSQLALIGAIKPSEINAATEGVKAATEQVNLTSEELDLRRQEVYEAKATLDRIDEGITQLDQEIKNIETQIEALSTEREENGVRIAELKETQTELIEAKTLLQDSDFRAKIENDKLTVGQVMEQLPESAQVSFSARIENFIQTASDTVWSTWQSATDVIGNAMDIATDTVGSVVKTAHDGLGKITGAVSDGVAGTAHAITDAAKRVHGRLTGEADPTGDREGQTAAPATGHTQLTAQDVFKSAHDGVIPPPTPVTTTHAPKPSQEMTLGSS